jgi:hypothetical protein
MKLGSRSRTTRPKASTRRVFSALCRELARGAASRGITQNTQVSASCIQARYRIMLRVIGIDISSLGSDVRELRQQRRYLT